MTLRAHSTALVLVWLLASLLLVGALPMVARVVPASGVHLAVPCNTGPARHKLPDLGQVDGDWFRENPYAADSSVHAYVIANERHDYARFTDIGPELQMTERRVMRIVDAAGLDHGTVRIQMYAPKASSGGTQSVQTVKGYTYNYTPGGQVERQELEPAQVFTNRLDKDFVEVSFSLPSLRAGSVIDYEVYRLSSFLTRPPVAYLQDVVPVQHSSYRFVYSGKLAYQALVIGREKVEQHQGQIRTGGGGVEVEILDREYTFEASNLPALTREPYLTTLTNYLTRVELGLSSYAANGSVRDFSQTWETIADNLLNADLTRLALKGNKTFDEWAANYTGPDTEDDKARWALNEVTRRLEWDGYSSTYPTERPQRLLDGGKGSSADLNAVLLGLVRALSLEAYPVYLSTRERGYLFKDIPTANAFSTMIVGLGAQEGKVTLLDATDPTGEVGIIPIRNLNGEGLLVAPKWNRFISLQDRAVAQQALNAELTLDADHHLVGSVTLTLRDYAAYPFTSLQNGVTVLDSAKLKVFEGFTVSDIAMERGSGYGWVYTAQVRSKEPAIDLGDGLAFDPVLMSTWLTNPFARDTRHFPVEFPHQLVETRRIVVKLPANYEMAEASVPMSISTPDKTVAYRYQVAGEGNTLILSTSLLVRRLYHAPEHYAGLRDIFTQVAARETDLVSVRSKL